MSVTVNTRGYDFRRSGVNREETVLTAQAVAARGIKKLFTLATPDDARGCEASPLVVPGVHLADGSVHDVVVLATMANWIYAFDADHGALLWSRHLGTPIDGSQKIDAHLINQHWGILSTPVIDHGTIYGCAWISHDGTAEKGEHFAFAVDVATGTLTRPLLSLEGTVFTPGHGLAPIRFRSAQRKQRAALAITGGALIIPFGTIAETAQTAHGWLIALDLASWRIAANWCSTARGFGGGIWMAGAGPVVLDDGDLAFFTGNGDFDGVTDFGESLVRLRYKPASAHAEARFDVVDWWTPWTDTGRAGEGVEADGPPMPTNLRKIGRLAERGLLRMGMVSGEWADMDLGSAGITYLASLDLLAGAGKDGILYAAKSSSLGRTMPGDLTPANNQANYGKLAFRPIFFTYYPPDLDPAPTQIETLNTLFAGRTHHQHGAPIAFDSAQHGPMLFNWGENGNGRAWQVTAAGCKYLACTVESASPEARVPPGGMPGAMLSVSCDHAQDASAVLWACVPYGDANMTLTAGRLVAYAATSFENGLLVKLWDSQDWAHQFTHNKFAPPVVANGKLFLPTYDGQVIVYGLA
jgi:outer membrane protein assembly factor BamB